MILLTTLKFSRKKTLNFFILFVFLILSYCTSFSQIITTIAGTGSASFSGDGNVATAATLNLPYAMAADASGNIYIADRNNHRIRKISSSGIISTIAGNGNSTFSGDGNLATSATISNPYGLTIDRNGNIYIADFSNHRIRKIATNGIITTVAGNGTAAFSGDGGTATSASLNAPTGVSVDVNGNIYIADYNNNRIRKVTASTGIITTVAGTGTIGFSGDGGLATSATFYNPYDVQVDKNGNLYIADFLNHRIRRVSTNGVITTIAGLGTTGNGNGSFSGDGSLATSATLHGLTRLVVDTLLNIFIADYANHRIRKIATNGIISTVAGNGTAAFSGDGGLATSASINTPTGIALDSSGNLYIADLNNYRIRKVTNAVLPLTLLTFNGNKQNEAIALQWTTTNEINTASFSIQRAADGTNFSDVGLVAANGNTTSTTAYTFTDNQPNNGKNYYRLKMMDKDGSFTYSSVLAFISQAIATTTTFKLSPNPAKTLVQLQVAVTKDDVVNVTILDAAGKKLLTQTNSVVTGTNVLRVNNINNLKSGLYFVQMAINGAISTQRLIIE